MSCSEVQRVCRRRERQRFCVRRGAVDGRGYGGLKAACHDLSPLGVVTPAHIQRAGFVRCSGDGNTRVKVCCIPSSSSTYSGAHRPALVYPCGAVGKRVAVRQWLPLDKARLLLAQVWRWYHVLAW